MLGFTVCTFLMHKLCLSFFLWGVFLLGLSLWLTWLLYYYSILEFFPAIAIIPMQVLLVCSNYAHFIILRKHLKLEGGQASLLLVSISPHSPSSLLSLIVKMWLSWCWSLFSQLTLSSLFATTWQFAHAPCCYFGIMRRCFWLATIPYCAQHNRSKPNFYKSYLYETHSLCDKIHYLSANFYPTF